MNALILAFRSGGDVISGERKLLEAGIDVRLTDSPEGISRSCNICLRVNSADIGKIRLLLGKSIRGIYIDNEDGKGYAPWLP